VATANHSIVDAKPGDWIEIHQHNVGIPGRRGQILEILGRPGHEHYRVRWDEEHESIFYPADGSARIIPAEAHD
jgi:hypothetical protein